MAAEFKNDEDRGSDYLDPSSKELRGIHRTLRAEPLRVMLADDDRLFVEGVAALLSGWEEFELVGRAYTLEDAFMLTMRLNPSVVMMGATMRGVPCADVVGKICAQSPDTRVMILASMGESGFVLDALRAGARGFGSRDELTSDRLRSLVWALACGDIAFSGSLGTQLQGALMGKDGKMAGYLESETCIAALDDRERTILARLEEGLSNAEISNRLYLSEPTVKKAIGSILRKLHVNNRVQAAVMYAKYSQ